MFLQLISKACIFRIRNEETKFTALWPTAGCKLSFICFLGQSDIITWKKIEHFDLQRR